MDSGGSFTNDRWDRSPEDCAGLYEKEKSKAFFPPYPFKGVGKIDRFLL